MNAFTDVSRDARLSVGVPGLTDKLRAPEILARMVMVWKPATTGLGDHLLRALLNDHLMSAIVAGDYRLIQRTLDTLFGPHRDDPVPGVTPVTAGANGHHR